MDYYIYFITRDEGRKFSSKEGCYSWIEDYFFRPDLPPSKRFCGDLDSFCDEDYFKDSPKVEALLIEDETHIFHGPKWVLIQRFGATIEVSFDDLTELNSALAYYGLNLEGYELKSR